MTKFRYDPDNDYLEDSNNDDYEQNKRTKFLRNSGLEQNGSGGNKSRTKRNKKETHRIAPEESQKESKKTPGGI